MYENTHIGNMVSHYRFIKNPKITSLTTKRDISTFPVEFHTVSFIIQFATMDL